MSSLKLVAVALGTVAMLSSALAIPTIVVSDAGGGLDTSAHTGASGTVTYYSSDGFWSVVVVTGQTVPAVAGMELSIAATSMPGSSAHPLTVTFSSDYSFIGPLLVQLSGHVVAGTGSCVRNQTSACGPLTDSGNLSNPYAYSNMICGSACPLTQVVTICGGTAGGTYSLDATVLPTTNKMPATVTLGNLDRYFDGTPKPVSITTLPPGLPVSVTYEGSTTAPTNSGRYTVIGSINDLCYHGGATNALVIIPALSPAILPGGAFRVSFAFTNGNATNFTVLTATNPALALSNWPSLGNPTEGPPGQFQFTDPAATSLARRFYRLLYTQ